MSTYRHVADSAPYYDDYVGSEQESKGYVKVLWKPSRAVQARELTQMQTYSQKQIAEMGGYLFKDGTVVHGGVISTTTKQKYFIGALTYPTGMSIEDAMAGYMAFNKDGGESSGFNGIYAPGINGVKFQLVGWETASDLSKVTTDNLLSGTSTTMIVVFYNIFGGTFASDNRSIDGYVSPEDREAAMSMTFTNEAANEVSLKVASFFKANPQSRDDIYLTCTRAFCTKGTVFVDGYFVNCGNGAVMVNPITVNDTTVSGAVSISVKDIFNDNQEYHIGFWIDRKIVDAYEDPTLTDPASGTYNHKASGADRYSIIAKLTCLSEQSVGSKEALDSLLQVESVGDNNDNAGATKGIKFCTGIIMKNNIVIKEQSNIGANAELMDELARRTYEESGNYTVKPWKVQIENAESSDENTLGEDIPDKYTVSISPGLGYIYGYRVSTCVSQNLENERARTKIVRPVSRKYAEDSLSVVSADIYSLNASGQNLHSMFLNTVAETSRVVLLDRQLSELVSDSNVRTLGDVATAYTNALNKSIFNLGTAAVNCIEMESDTELRIYLLDVEGPSTLYEVSSIAAFDSNGRLAGYIDLKHEGADNITVWNAVEEPLIFETDWQYVAPEFENNDSNTYAMYTTAVTLTSPQNGVTQNNEGKACISFPLGDTNWISAPQQKNDINYVVDKVDGTLIPSSKFTMSAPTDYTADSSLKLTEESVGTFNVSHTYIISYNGLLGAANSADTLKNLPDVGSFKQKILCIGRYTIDSSVVGNLKAYAAGTAAGEDVIHLRDDSDSIQSGDTAPYVTDFIKLLAIEERKGTGTSQTTSDAPKEIYWNASNGLASMLEIDNGCRDYCYQNATISGIGKWYNSIQSDSQEENVNLRLVFAYWKHKVEKNGCFYYAGSYIADRQTATFKSIDALSDENAGGLSVYQRRLAEWYDIKSLSEASNDVYRLIPKYQSQSGAWYDLANCFDFRPDWFGDTALAPMSPVPSSLVTYKVVTYLPRIDTVCVDKEGYFQILKGTPSDTPMAPSQKDGMMAIYNIYNKPYGKTLADIVPEYIDNRRHTMVDITAIANRLSNLEEVVAMSMAEQSAANMQILDEDGINRYKCGIFTESFGSYENCGFSEEGWSATIDTVERCVRPDFEIRNWGFSVLGDYVRDEQSLYLKTPRKMGVNPNPNKEIMVFGQNATVNGEKVGGTILTMAPLVNAAYSSSSSLPSKYSFLYANSDAITESTNVQSLMFIVWNGNLVLTPAIDTWVNDLGEQIKETWTDSEQPPSTFREWTTTTDGTTTQTTVKQTVPSGMTYKDLDKLYGDNWRNVPKSQRITHLPGWWEPATTISEVATYKTVTATKVTETTTYTGSWQANDVSTYMESQDSYMRVRKVKFVLEGMRPNQRFKAAMDKVPLKLLSVDQFNDVNAKESDYVDEITTDSDGKYTGYFVVPERMPTGTKVVEFYDGEETSAAQAEYTANGKTVWTNVDRNYIRTWTAETSETYGKPETTIGKKIDTKTVATATAIFHNNDPIAESFYVEEENGVTLESVQIFFAAKDPSVGVEVFIVECENGYPGQTVVPFSRVFVPSSAVNVTSKEDVAKNGAAPTTFKFPVPIQLQGLTEYAIVVIASSYNYEVYTSTLGKADLHTGIGVKEQPYTGTMYKSQNLRTWNAEPMSDMAFRLYKYQFQTSSEFCADFVLDDFVSTNTGLDTTLPSLKNATELTEDSFLANSMTISAGTYIPASTSIKFTWHSGMDTANGTPFENKQDIFLKDANGMQMGFNIADVPNTPNVVRNTNSSLFVRAMLSTKDPNIAPQIDLEDFCGIFTRNTFKDKISTDNGEYLECGTYFTNTIVLKDPAIGLKVALDAMLPNKSYIKVYFKSSGKNSEIDTIEVPGIGYDCTVYSQSYENSEGGTASAPKVQMPGAKLSSIDDIAGERCYIWYYVQDSIDTKKKFVVPNQIQNANASVATLRTQAQSSCVIEKMTVSTGGTNKNSTLKCVLKDSVNLHILKQPNYSYDSTTKTGTIRFTQQQGAANIFGIYAIPMKSSLESYKDQFNPSKFFESVTGSDTTSHLYGLQCEPYSAATTYNQGDLCLYGDEFWRCLIDDTKNLSPNADAIAWERVPCLLFATSPAKTAGMDSQWIELNCDEYKPSTERETNFMEYSYSTTSAMEINEFDSFMVKARMFSLNTRDVPRFRNLRAVAVY